jgi:DNA repair ATPase RecN
MEKQKYFPNENLNEINNKPEFANNFNPISNINNTNYSNNLPNDLMPAFDRYKNFYEILKEDLKSQMDCNVNLVQEINDIEEERQYYLDKINNVLSFAQYKLESFNIDPESEELLENIIKIITHVPEDFK